MMIAHPLLGLRDAAEFTIYGDACMMQRPIVEDPANIGDDDVHRFYEFMYLRDNLAGVHRELWYHEQGDRSWLVVTRNTLTHEIIEVELASEVARKLKGSGAS